MERHFRKMCNSNIDDFSKSQSGFTVLEIMVVLAMIVIMASIAMPRITNIIPRYHLKEAARTFYMDLRQARSSAIKEGSPCIIEFITGGYRIFIDKNQNNTLDGSDSLIKQVQWSNYSDVQVSNNTFGTCLRFGSDGLPRNCSGGFGAGAITLNSTSSGASLSVSMSMAGSIRIQ